MNKINQIFKRIKEFNIVFLMFFLFCSKALSERYRIESEHFSIIYDKGLEKEALIVKEFKIPLQMFELITKPKYKIEVYLIDSNIENSFVPLIVPYRIILYPNTLTSYPKNYDRWIEYVLTHELTHSLLSIYSKSFIYNITIPAWIHEGFAVYMETKFQAGRGKNNLFVNVHKSCKFKSSPILEDLAYENGYALLKFIADKYSEEYMINKVKEASKIFSFSPNAHKNFFAKEIEEWKASLSSDNEKREKVERPKTYFNKETLIKTKYIKGYKDKIYFHASYFDSYITHYINEYDPKTSEVKKIKELFDLKFFLPGEKLSYIKSVNIDELVACVQDKYDAKIKDPKILGYSTYATRKYGQEALYKDHKLLIPEERGCLFFGIMEYQDRLFLEMSFSYMPGRFLVELLDDKLMLIDEALNCSINEGKIYYVKDRDDKQVAYEYDINSSKRYELFESNIIVSPVNIEDKIYFVSFEDQEQYLYSTKLERGKKKHISPREIKELKNDIDLDPIKLAIKEECSMPPLFSFPIPYPVLDLDKLRFGLGLFYVFTPAEFLEKSVFESGQTKYAVIGVEVVNKSRSNLFISYADSVVNTKLEYFLLLKSFNFTFGITPVIKFRAHNLVLKTDLSVSISPEEDSKNAYRFPIEAKLEFKIPNGFLAIINNSEYSLKKIKYLTPKWYLDSNIIINYASFEVGLFFANYHKKLNLFIRESHFGFTQNVNLNDFLNESFEIESAYIKNLFNQYARLSYVIDFGKIFPFIAFDDCFFLSKPSLVWDISKKSTGVVIPLSLKYEASGARVCISYYFNFFK